MSKAAPAKTAKGKKTAVAAAVEHTQRAHAVLSASGSDRWMNCPGSIRLEALAPPESESPYAAWGTQGHEYAEQVLRKQKTVAELPEEFQEVVQKYVDYVLALGGTLFIEHRFDLSWLHPNMFGTCDAIVIVGNVMHVVDLKTGQGVKVDAENNTQLLYYALGAYHDYGYLWDIKTIKLHIVQPRIYHYDSWELPAC